MEAANSLENNLLMHLKYLQGPLVSLNAIYDFTAYIGPTDSCGKSTQQLSHLKSRRQDLARLKNQLSQEQEGSMQQLKDSLKNVGELEQELKIVRKEQSEEAREKEIIEEELCSFKVVTDLILVKRND